VTWIELQTEFRQSTIGPLILSEVERAVDLAIRRHDPVVYAGASAWSEARNDLVQDVVVTILLEERQLDYLIQTANSLDDFRALMFRQVRRLLARRRQRTVIDNLLGRIRAILDAPPFERAPGLSLRYQLRDRPRADRPATDDEIRLAAIRVAAIPRIRFNVSERAPIVYAPTDLEAAVLLMAEALPTPLTLGDIDRILRLVLTDWIPSFLEEGEETFTAQDKELTPEEMVVVQDIVSRLLSATTADQQLILRRKMEGTADGTVAAEIGVSRPTLAARKDAVFDIVAAELDGLDAKLQRAVTGALAVQLSTTGAEE
jgi:hypothetical protein